MDDSRTSPTSNASTRVVDVQVPVAVDQAYSYRVPRGLDLKPGDVVAVPLGPREVLGVVWAENPNPDPRLHNRLKDVAEKLDVPPLREELRRLVDWVANYTLSPRGQVLRMTLRMGELGPERQRMGVRLVGPPPQRMTPARRRLIEILSDGLLHGKSDVAKEAGVSPGVIDGLVDEGTLHVEAMPREPAAPTPDPDFSPADFSPEQARAAETMRELVKPGGGFQAALLDGVTGSGKTEVYFEAVAEVVRQGRQCLILMPEIALTGQFLDRFALRFGVRPLEWHSELTPRTRARNWAAIAAGEAQVVVGARSALF
ncbi:DEAD/DEAH box helicase, partial [Rhodopseudomonas palustris]|nr:DEAD/DEAH box helicase [Rhodopseudomonas palustris]